MGSHLLTDQGGQPFELRTALVFVGLQEGLVSDAHGADVELLHSDVTAHCRQGAQSRSLQTGLQHVPPSKHNFKVCTFHCAAGNSKLSFCNKFRCFGFCFLLDDITSCFKPNVIKTISVEFFFPFLL